MAKLQLNVEALDVTSFEAGAASVGPREAVMTGTTGYCNTCYSICNWTE